MIDYQNVSAKSGTSKIVWLIVALFVVTALSVCASMYFSYNNQEISLRKQAEAQRGKVEGVFDTMWKTIS